MACHGTYLANLASDAIELGDAIAACGERKALEIQAMKDKGEAVVEALRVLALAGVDSSDVLDEIMAGKWCEEFDLGAARDEGMDV